MKMKIMKSAVRSAAFASVITLTSGSVFAQEAKTLDQLLDFVNRVRRPRPERIGLAKRNLRAPRTSRPNC
jgi:hypothetical protein